MLGAFNLFAHLGHIFPNPEGSGAVTATSLLDEGDNALLDEGSIAIDE